MRITVTRILAVVSVLSLPSAAGAFEVDVHAELTSRAVTRSGLDPYLEEQLRLPDGVATAFDGRSVDGWLVEGAIREDDGTRPLNHFHNPLRTWDAAGLTWPSGQSSTIWGQTGSGNTDTWKDARDAFYDALTNPSPTQRDTAMGTALRRLGHQLHLVQDAAVPAHTRNDRHPANLGSVFPRLNLVPITLDPEPLEIHTLRLLKQDPGRFDALASGLVVSFDPAILEGPPNPLAPVPVARAIDTTDPDQPAASPAPGTSTGLAEYSNAQFLSKSTIFRSFAFPSVGGLGERYCTPDRRRCYHAKLTEGEVVDHFVALGHLRRRLPLDHPAFRGTLMLDQRVTEDYASFLLPRAIAYGAGLLDYFVRGKLALDHLSSDRYAITNLGNEAIRGTFRVHYDRPGGSRVPLAEVTSSKTLKTGDSVTVRFTPPTDAAIPGVYLVTFRGTMGNEETIAVAASVDDVPTPAGVDAGRSHKIPFHFSASHTHSGASAVDGNNDLASYAWSWESCPSTCPTLTGSVSGSLSGGREPVPVPGPTFQPNAAGSFRLKLQVFDQAGNASQDTAVHTTSNYVCFGGETFPEPYVYFVLHPTPQLGTPHPHTFWVANEYDRPHSMFFDWDVLCCDAQGSICTSCPAGKVETNRDSFVDPELGKPVLRDIAPGTPRAVDTMVTFLEPGRYRVRFTYRLDLAGESGSCSTQKWVWLAGDDQIP